MSSADTSNSESRRSNGSSSGDEEKTIPFLRRLRDMLLENEEIVSFYPGSRTGGNIVLGRMVVHDRARIESEVLPRYFNHASFASLRRQLNYFCFTRVGKGRQRGATYCNDGVVELDDILSLKRRPSGANAAAAIASAPRKATPTEEEEELREETVQEPEPLEQPELITASVSATAKAVVPFVHLPPSKKRNTKAHHPVQRKKSRFFKKRESPTAVISPMGSSHSSEDELIAPPKQVLLDLTKPSDRLSSKKDYNVWKLNPSTSAFETYNPSHNNEATASTPKDEDLMAGCVALLSFSNEAMRLALT
jgi:hypothetical protein